MKPHKFKAILALLQIILDKFDSIENLLSDLHSSIRKNDELLSINQASKLINLSVATIYSKVSRNEIPVNKVGKKLYFYRSELEDWIRSGRIRTALEIRRDVEGKFRSAE